MAYHSFPTALRTLVLVATLGASVLAAEPEPTPQARAYFKAGVEHLRKRNYGDAYREFKASYAETPTWKVLGNIGIAADKLERDGEAIDALQRYLDEGQGGVSAREASQARADLERLRLGIATVMVEASGPFWIVDARINSEAPVVNEYGPFDGRAELRLRAGDHQVKLERTSIEAPEWSASLLPGDVATHRFGFQSEPTVHASSAPVAIPAPDVEADAPSHVAAYIVWGAGVVGAGVSTGLYFKSRSVQQKADAGYDAHCPPDGTDPSDFGCANALADDASAANWRTATLVTGIGALGALLGGTVLYLLEGRTDGGDAAEASLQPWAGPTSIGITGTF